MPLTLKQLRSFTWNEVYSYGKPGQKSHFKVFGCDDCPGLTVVHDFKGQKTIISYRVNKRSTDSPSQAVKWVNAAERAKQSGGHCPPGSVETIKAATAAVR